MDASCLHLGYEYISITNAVIHLCDRLILVLLEHAMQSVWVKREAVAARRKEDRLL
jgi:hypothetical protein